MTLTVEIPDHLVRRLEDRHPGVPPVDFVMAAVTKAMWEPTPSPLSIVAALVEADPLSHEDDELWDQCAGDGLDDEPHDERADAA